ncbi:MAG: hypothetical protein IPO40_21775 [Fibrobacteres bacterium]|nr:hypothetical protein [Fibrobacterota bacterium]
MLLSLFATLIASAPDTLLRPDTLPAAKPVVVSLPAVSSPTKSSFENYGRWQFGFSGGRSTGGGLAVRHWLDEKNGFELHGYAYLSKKNYPDDGDSWGSHRSEDGYYYGGDTGDVAQGEIQLGVQYLHEVVRIHLFTANGAIKGPSHLRGLTFVGVGGYADFEDRSLRSSRSEYKRDPSTLYGYYQQVPYRIESHTSTQQVLGGGGGGLEFELSRFSVHLLVGMGGFYQLDPSEYEVGPTVDGGIFLRF